MTKPDEITVELVESLTTIEEFINLIIDAFGISEDDVQLTSIDIFTLTEATVEIDSTKGIYNFTVGVTIDINQDESENATKELSGSLKIDMTYESVDKYKGEYGGSLSIPLSDGSTNLIFDLYYITKQDSSTGDVIKLIIGQLNVQQDLEEDIGDVNLASLVGEICPSLEPLFPEELVEAFNLQENVLFGIYSTAPRIKIKCCLALVLMPILVSVKFL